MYMKLALQISFVALVSLSGCMTPPSKLDLSLTRPSAHEKFIVSIHPLADPVSINQIHAWQVQLISPSGDPISNARIDVDGGMPQHAHGLPTHPRVRELVDGMYILEGMKFSMPGWWEIKLAINTADVSDKVIFNTVVSPTVVR